MLANRLRVQKRGLGEYVKSLLHFNGVQGTNTFIDETGKIWTPVGNARHDTSQKKFGIASVYFDGIDDHISTPNHADFDFGSGDFTIDFWVRPAAIGSTTQHVIRKGSGSTAYVPWRIIILPDGRIGFDISTNGSSWAISAYDGLLAANTWYHVALVRYGTSVKLYLNGTSIASGTVTGALVANTGPVIVADSGLYTNQLRGYIDELLILKGLALWTENFTPPEEEYTI